MFVFFLAIENENNKVVRDKAERLYLQYRYLMFSVANKILKDSHLAEDAVQQAFLKILKNIEKINEENVPATRSFLVIICRNTSLDILREKQYLNKNSDDIDNIEIESAEMSPEELTIDQMSVDRIVAAIQTLPDTYRDVVMLRHYHKYDRAEIAKTLNLPIETVKKRLVRAKKLLTEILAKEGIE